MTDRYNSIKHTILMMNTITNKDTFSIKKMISGTKVPSRYSTNTISTSTEVSRCPTAGISDLEKSSRYSTNTITVMRCAESMVYTNIPDINLSMRGAKQAQELYGEYDLVLCSPLRRCVDTLRYSKIEYNELVLDYGLREIVSRRDLPPFARRTEVVGDQLRNLLAFEKPGEFSETQEDIEIRVDYMKRSLYTYSRSYGSILVLSHEQFIEALVGCSLDNTDSILLRLV